MNRLLLFILGAASLSPVALGGTLVVVADRFQGKDGTLISGGRITVSGGKIVAIGDGGGEGSERHVYEGGVICPGGIDLSASLGASGHRREDAHPIDPGASAVDVVDPHHRDFREAILGGVTGAMIAPSTSNLVSGAAVVVKTSGDVVAPEGPLALSLGPSVWTVGRAPTSRIGSLALMREVLSGARDGVGHRRLVEFARGDGPGVCLCETSMDVDAALRTFAGCRLSIAYSGPELGLVDRLAPVGVPLIVGPLDYDMEPRTLMLAAKANQAGVAVAFGGGLPERGADSLRVSAALAVLHGMPPASARLAVTSVPARIAGVADRLGMLKVGMDADLVVYSDDPLRLDSRVLGVYVSGRRLFVEQPRVAGGEQ